MTTVQAPPAELSPIQFESLKAWQRWTAAAEHPDVLRPVDCQSVPAMLGELPKAARWGRSSQIFTPSQQHQQPTSAKFTDDQDFKKSYDAQGWLRAEHLVSLCNRSDSGSIATVHEGERLLYKLMQRTTHFSNSQGLGPGTSNCVLWGTGRAVSPSGPLPECWRSIGFLSRLRCQVEQQYILVLL